MSAHSLPSRRGWLSALVAQAADYVLEPVAEPEAEAAPIEMKPRPVIAVASAARRSGASTVARLLAAELAHRAGGAAVVVSNGSGRRAAPPSRSAVRLATALAGAGPVQPTGRLCLATADDPRGLIAAARYLAPVVIDVLPDGSASRVREQADRVVVVGSAAGERALLEAVATIIGGQPLRVLNRWASDPDANEPGGAALPRNFLTVPESRIAARAAVMGTRPLGALGVAIGALVDLLDAPDPRAVPDPRAAPEAEGATS